MRGRILGKNPGKSLFTVASTASSSGYYFFKFTQSLTVSKVQILCTVKEKGEKPDRKPYNLHYGLRNPYRNLKSENYAQKPQQNCTFMYSASGTIPFQVHKLFTVSN
jgi:hypothetical protein